MKKSVLMLAGFYVVLLIAFVFTQPTRQEVVTIITVKEELSRILYRDEHLKLAIFSDVQSSFLWDETQVVSARLISDEFEIEIEIKDFETLDESVTYRNQEYGKVIAEIDFEMVSFGDESILQMPDAILFIEYMNGAEIYQQIGSLYLVFLEEVDVSPVSLNRLSGVPFYYDGSQGICGIIIELEDLYEEPIQINWMSSGMDTASFDLSKIQVLSTAEGVTSEETRAENILSEHSLLEEVFLFEGSVILYIPLIFDESSLFFNRFPIVLDIEILNIQKRIYFDDFVFYRNQYSRLEVYEDVLDITRYHYD